MNSSESRRQLDYQNTTFFKMQPQLLYIYVSAATKEKLNPVDQTRL